MASLCGNTVHEGTWQNDLNSSHNPKVVGSNPASATTKNGLPMQVEPFFIFA
jgi:hypothetical protein